MSLPPQDNLKSIIQFDHKTGKISLGQQRMLLLHSSAFGALRTELINSLGLKHAKEVLLRMGHYSGTADAALARNLCPDEPDSVAFTIGPQLHTLEGIVRVEEIKLDMDFDTGKFYSEYYWHDSFEAEEHVKASGIHTEPVCWSQIGYACGYSSAFMGQPIIYKEVECVGMGHKHCRIIGKPLLEWEDAKQLATYFSTEPLAETLYTLKDEVHQLRTTLAEELIDDQIIAEAPASRAVQKSLAVAADNDVTVLVLGETGVGKEVFARAIHKMSSRGHEAFVTVNCAALPIDLIEAELFGVEKGAYTGAHKSRPGRFERAHRGILFLDEIGEMSESAQTKLLRVLQTGEIERVGDDKTRQVDVRLITATNADLEQKVKDGTFRADLFYRLNVFPLTLPPLRERLQDIPALAELFIKRFSAKHSKRISGISDQGKDQLASYPWPGNIRELENFIERGVILCPGDIIQTEHLFINQNGPAPSAENSNNKATETGDGQLWDQVLKKQHSLEEIETQLLQNAINKTHGNVSAAARLLKMGDAQFRYRLKKYAIKFRK